MSRYQRLSGVDHVLLRPDTYVGDPKPSPVEDAWVVTPDRRLAQTSAVLSPGLLKIFDEILVNASDNRQRDPSTNQIRVAVDATTISVTNTGRSLPVAEHETETGADGAPLRIPELVFGHLRSGENFDDTQRRTVGGRNGLGAKLANVFSTSFEIEIVAPDEGKRYTQRWTHNMKRVEPPKIRACKAKSRTTVTFAPEIARFGLASIDAAHVEAMRRRVYDVAGCLGKGVSVYFNEERVPVASFLQYAKMADPAVVVAEVGDRWTVGVAASAEGSAMRHLSFVNGIATTKGGTHVRAVGDHIAKHLKKALGKRVGAAQPAAIRNQLFVFVRCLVDNPAFSSQTKEELTTRAADFGSAPDWASEAGRAFLDRVARGAVGRAVVEWSQRRAAAADQRELERSSGAKKARVQVEKLEDANLAGTRRASECTLILTEGDSAAALAIAGLAVVGRDRFGVFPLKGKPLNVRDAPTRQITKNAEIQNIVTILGLKFGQSYAAGVGSLRYGRLVIMADQDADGSHIKGLVLNLFAHFWPCLFRRPGFLQQFITPLVKARRGPEVRVFYTLQALAEWQRDAPDAGRYALKYYKGLGTSTAAEARDYFRDLARHRIDFRHTEACADAIDLAFRKARAADRRGWLEGMDRAASVDYSAAVPYKEFVDRELVHFSRYDNERSIPSALDGLKPSQRKVLFGCFRRRLTDAEIKVAQLAGYVAEHSAYHHGEASLMSTIVNMAQDHVGSSNNVNLLRPEGQFGTRDKGGKDAASPRYIFTRLTPAARLLFPEADDALLPEQTDDGMPIEPAYYAPVVPLVLLNGAEGIGTGWSTAVPPHRPAEVIANVRRLLEGRALEPMAPWWRGFAGTVEAVEAAGPSPSFRVRGVARRSADGSVEVTELPVRVWTQAFKAHLERLADAGTIAGFTNQSTDTQVRFRIDGLAADADLVAVLKLEVTVATANMHLFDATGAIRKYADALEIVRDFFPVRLALYRRRHAALVEAADAESRALSEKARFIEAVRAGEVDLRARDAEVRARLADLAFENADPLLAMRLSSLTEERAAELRAQSERAAQELAELRGVRPEDLWQSDLDALEREVCEADPGPSLAKRARRDP